MNNSKIFKNQTLFSQLTFLTATFFLLTLSQSIYAQARFGVKASYENYQAGPSYTDYSADGIVYHNRVSFLHHENGQAFGLFYHRKSSFLFLQADVLYNQYSSVYKVEFLSETGMLPEFAQEHFKTVDIAITGGYNFKKFDIGLGPIIHKNIEHTTDLSQYSFYMDRMKNLTMGFQFSVAYNWGLFRLEAKMEDMFSKPGGHIGFQNGKRNKFDTAQSIFKLQFGIGF